MARHKKTAGLKRQLRERFGLTAGETRLVVATVKGDPEMASAIAAEIGSHFDDAEAAPNDMEIAEGQ